MAWVRARAVGRLGSGAISTSDGRAERFEYMANFGKDIMVTGIPEYDSVTLRKVDDLTSDAVLSRVLSSAHA